MNQKEYFGYGSISHLLHALRKHKAKNIFLVTGNNSYELSGAEELISNILKPFSYYRHFDFSVNITLCDVEKGVSLFQDGDFDVIIAIGGGSVIDMAKLVNVLSAQPNQACKYINNEEQIENKGQPLIAIPTTAGSGSEATHFATFYIDKTKHSLEHEFILPDVSIVDPRFMKTLPEYIAACSGMDALGHAIESLWSINSTPQSINYSSRALELINVYLLSAVCKSSEQSISALAKGANLAGKAIRITKTTASHAIAYPLTSYFSIAHGHAVAITLPYVLEYNAGVTKDDLRDERGCRFVQERIRDILNALETRTVNESKVKLTHLMENLNMKTTLHDLEIINECDIELIVKNVIISNRLKNNPRMMTEKQVREILNKLNQ